MTTAYAPPAVDLTRRPLAGAALEAALQPLHDRRSANALAAPGPDADQLGALLRAAATAPDHGMLRPYRFVVVREDGKAALGAALVDAAREALPGLPAEAEAKIAGKTALAPVMVLLVASPVAGHKVPEWEQVAAASCAGYGLVLAADLAGFGAVWKSAPAMGGTALTRLLALAPGEQVLGWVNLGTRVGVGPARRPVAAGEVATSLVGDALGPLV